MIVLDEQLLGRGLENAIARWYQGAAYELENRLCHFLIAPF